MIIDATVKGGEALYGLLKRCGVGLFTATGRGGRRSQRAGLILAPSLFLCLSLSFRHTHTHVPSWDKSIGSDVVCVAEHLKL